MAANYFRTTLTVLNGKHIAIATVIVVIILSYVLSDISQKIQASNELKSMKKVLDMVSNEVTRAEVACLTVTDEIRQMNCALQDGCTETVKNLQGLSTCTSNSIRPTQSEPVHVEQKFGFFRRTFFPNNNNASHKEVTIMSYVYTDSFDAKKQ